VFPPLSCKQPLTLARPQRFNSITQTCFDQCVNDFTSKTLGSREETCMSRCFEKMNAAEQRGGSRFQEAMAAQQGAALQN